jgi:CHAT domain-containing protein/tetratricopeptide (TPR) repeat protein
MTSGNKTTRSTDDGMAFGTLLEDLIGLESEDQLRELLERKPEILSPEMREFLEEIAAHPGRGIYFRRQLRLLNAARVDPQAAWTQFSQKLKRDNATCAELGPLVDQINAALAAERPAEAIGLAEAVIDRACEAEAGLLVATFEAQRAQGLLALREGDRRANVEEAIAGFRRALGGTVQPDEAARIVMALAVAFAERIEGDPADNAELAVKALRDALSYLDENSQLDLSDDLQLNLANALMRRERGDRVANLGEGVALCQAVLAHRTPTADGSQWGRAQLNLAALLYELKSVGDAARGDAAQAYESVIGARGQVPDWQVAMAHYSLGRGLRILAVGDNESHAEVALEGPSAQRVAEEERVEAQRLMEAREHLETAESLAVADPDPIRIGRILAELADVHHRLGEVDEALEAARRGFELLTPQRSPRECVGVARHLGHLLALRKEWPEAVVAFRAAVECSELVFNSRLSPKDREAEAKRAGNLTRWAAYALAAAGEPLEAALVLENGRTREMRQRFGLPAAETALLDELPEELRETYLAALARTLKSPLGPGRAPGSRDLQEALDAIRSVPGFEDFAKRSRADDLLGALESGWPLLYVDPTPYGTLVLAITEEAGAAYADPMLLETPDSSEVMMRLLLGDGVETPELIGTEEGGSYLLAASGLGEKGRDIQPDVEHVLPWLGSALAKPIATYLADHGAVGVTLVPCGPLSLAPLHAAPWQEDSSDRCLIDAVEVRYAASAALAATCLERTRERADATLRLLALANPDGTLEAAIPEVEAIVSCFPADGTLWTSGSEARWAFLRAHAGEASHIHLACHAGAGIWGKGVNAIGLADGAVEASRLTDLAPMSARVVTISACQSAVVDLGHLPEEGFSVGGAVIAAGAACAIASLWPVRDDTTALLMVRLYEEMISNALRPPEALRRAQLWLRDLTDPELEAFLDSHPALKAEFRRRTLLGDRPGRRTPSHRKSAEKQRPYSGPDYWAPFIALGV